MCSLCSNANLYCKTMIFLLYHVTNMRWIGNHFVWNQMTHQSSHFLHRHHLSGCPTDLKVGWVIGESDYVTTYLSLLSISQFLFCLDTRNLQSPKAQNNSEVHLDDILPQGFAMLSTFYLWLFALVQINNCLDVWKGTTVNIATICKGNNRKVICGNLVENHWYLSKQVGRNLKRMLTSLLGHSEQAIINLHILTDEETKPWVDATVSNVVGRHITEGIVFGYEDNNVTLKTEFIGDKNLEAA